MPPKRNQKKGGSSQASRTASKAASKVPSRQDTPIPGTPASEPQKPIFQGETVVGINFGQTASSIAVINKEGLADCIANDDGDRQIATAVSFAGDQVYVGNPARQQLVRNNENTVLGFRDLLGKTYDEVKSARTLFNTASLVSHNGEPAYTVTLSTSPDSPSTQKTLTVSEVATIYLRTLFSYASDYLGRPLTSAVFSVPSTWSSSQRSALSKIAGELGVRTLQFVDAAGASAVAYGVTTGGDTPKAPALATKSSAEAQKTNEDGKADSNVIVLDVGGSSTTATVVAARGGLYVPLSSVSDDSAGGHELDARLVEHFAKEFTKKTKIPLDVTKTVQLGGGGDVSQHRAGMKLRLAAEVTKRSLSASTTANCSVDSLADGMDFSGSINRMRFDLLGAKVYAGIVGLVEKAVEASGIAREAVEEVVLIGGTTKLPAIADRVAALFPDSTRVTSTLEPDEAVAMGCALHARAIIDSFPPPVPSDPTGPPPTVGEKAWVVEKGLDGAKALDVAALERPLGILVPAPSDAPKEATLDGKVFVTLAAALTPLPLRRSFELPISKDTKAGAKVALALWEGEDAVHVESPPATNGKGGGDKGDDSEEESDEEEPKRTAIIKPTKAAAYLEVEVATAGQKKTATGLTVELAVDEQGTGRLRGRTSGVPESQAEEVTF